MEIATPQASGQAGKSGQVATFIQQRIHHGNRRQRPTPFPCRTAKSRHQSRFRVEGLDVAHAQSIWLRAAGSTSPLDVLLLRKAA